MPTPAPKAPWARCLLSALTLGALAACGGGGGGGGGEAAGSTPSAPTQTLRGVVADGPLQGAQVCLDLNGNGACDPAEPVSGPTDAQGRFSLQATATEIARHDLVAQVPASAVDADDPGRAVGVAFRLRAPAVGTASSAFVSPLTTLVADLAQASGISTAQAAERIQHQLKLPASPLSDFVAASDLKAALTARTVNQLMIEVIRMADQAGVPAEQRDALVRSAASQDLPVLAARIESIAQQTGGSPVQQRLEVAAQAAQAALEERNITPQTVVVQAGIAKALSATVAPTSGPEISLRRFRFDGVGDYSYTLHTGDPSSAGADGEFWVDEVRKQVSAGVDVPVHRNQAWWDGSQWTVCERSWRVARHRNQTATEPARGVWCGVSRYENRIVTRDISGVRLAEVVAEFRRFPLRDSDGSLPFAWGPDPALLGDAVFPAGSSMNTRQTISEIGGAELLYLNQKPRVRVAGWNHAATLEQLKGQSGLWGYPGEPVSNLTTAFVEDLPALPTAGAPAAAPGPYAPFKRYLVAFDPASPAVRFYKCDVLAGTDSTANCEDAGSGTSAITEQGDGRVLRITSGYPVELLARHKAQRIWVERLGVVFRGNTLVQNVHHNQRLNATAWTALRQRLGLPAHSEAVAPDNLAPFVQLRGFTFQDALNFVWRTSERSERMTAGVANSYEERRGQLVNGAVRELPPSPDEHWDGTRWVACPTLALGPATINPTTGERVRCGGYTTVWRSTPVTIDGLTVGEVLRDIRRFPGNESWGADPAALPAGAASQRLGPGSVLQHDRVLVTRGVTRFDPSRWTTVPVAAASGNALSWEPAPSLDVLLVQFTGALSGQPADGTNTLHVSSLWAAGSPPAGLTSEIQTRVSFDPVSGMATLWTARVSAGDGEGGILPAGTPVNFVQTERLPYRLEMLGGRRVLRLGAPANDGNRPLWVEHLATTGPGTQATRVSAGWHDGSSDVPVFGVSLNGAAWNSLRAALGIAGS